MSSTQGGAKPVAVTSEEDEESYSSSGELSSEDRATPADLFSRALTRLRWTPASAGGGTHLLLRQRVKSRRNVEFRFKACLNANNGAHSHILQLAKVLEQGTPSMARVLAAERGVALPGASSIDPQRFLPGGIRSLFLTDWALEPGLRLRSSSSSTPLAVSEGAGAAGVSADSGSGGKRGPLCFVTLRKQPQVLWRRGVWDCWLTGKVDLELARGSDEATTRASARLKVVRLNVTDKQDLLLALGADWQQTQGATGELTPYVKVGDASWCARLQRGLLTFEYEL